MQFHFIITLEVPDPVGVRTVCRDGVATVKRGQTRAEVFKDLITFLRDNTPGLGDNFVVKFFSLEPNALPTA